jgi:major membrane immunogen (membrane-anchored lipoprotein)
MNRFVLLLMASIVLVACGTKSDLTKPNGKPTSADQPDPSKPTRGVGE